MATSPLSSRLLTLSLIIGWVVLTIVQSLLLYKLQFPVLTAIIDGVISNSVLLIAGFLVLNAARYYVPSSYQYLSAIVSSFLIAGIWLFVINSLLKTTLGGSEAYLSFLSNSLVVRYGFAVLVLAIINFGALLLDNREEQISNIERQAATEKMAKEAELFKLRQQLQPHFLFNSLNSINALIGQNPPQARKMVQQLSDFLRGTLKKEESQLVSVEEEIKHLNLYLEIEKVRFGNRLQTELNIADDTKPKLIPALLLQPVVENAIKFGLYDTIGQTLIKIDTLMEADDLRIVVTNPHDPETSIPIKGTGFGLSSIKRRLYLLYARNDLLSTQSNDKIFITTVKIPQQS